MRRSLMADKLRHCSRCVVLCCVDVRRASISMHWAVHRPWKGLLEEPKYLQLLSGGSYRWLKGTSSEIILGWFKVRPSFPPSRLVAANPRPIAISRPR